jgi:nucleoside-diphosphate-sugar epimerase
MIAFRPSDACRSAVGQTILLFFFHEAVPTVNRAFVMGALGFIGAAVTCRLIAEGVTPAAALGPTPHPWREDADLQTCTVIECFFHDPAGYKAALADCAPDTGGRDTRHKGDRARRDDPERIHVKVPGKPVQFFASARAGDRRFITTGGGPPFCDTIALVTDLMDPFLENDFGEVPRGPGAVPRQKPDVRRLQSAGGWAPRMPLRAKIEANRSLNDMEESANVLVNG